MVDDPRLACLSAWRIPLKAVPLILPVSKRTVRRWSSTGKLKFCRIGGRLYTCVDALIDACPVQGGVADLLSRRSEVRDATARAMAIVRRGTEVDRTMRRAQVPATSKRVTGIEPATFSLGSGRTPAAVVAQARSEPIVMSRDAPLTVLPHLAVRGQAFPVPSSPSPLRLRGGVT